MEDPVAAAALSPLPERFARGWHCLGLERDFTDGAPHGVEAFGTKLVVFADSSGDLHVLDAYCRHMGGDLSRGSVKDDALACPFHDWRWDASGRCVSAPYSRRIPRLARTRKWHSCRQNRLVFVWHDPKGNPPPDEEAIPRADEAYDDEWADWSWDSWIIRNSHGREVVENLVDNAHFFYVHDGFPIEFRNVFEGHTAKQYLTTKGRADSDLGPDFANMLAHSESTYFGPAYVLTRLHSDFNGFVTEALHVACHYPLTRDSFVLQSGVLVKKPSGMDKSVVDGLAAMIVAGVNDGFVQDIGIFENDKLEQPVLCDEDGPVYQLRRWYEQFYVDIADVTPEMTERCEHDVDLSHAGEVWSREEAANVVRRTTNRADIAAQHDQVKS